MEKIRAGGRVASISKSMGAAVVAMTFATTALANLVVNGGFETGDLTGWVQLGNLSFTVVECPGPGPTVFEGNCSLLSGPQATPGSIAQAVVPTSAGQIYTISFWTRFDGTSPSSFAASFGPTTLTLLSNPPAGAQSFVFSAVGLSPQTTLTFSFRDDPGFIILDAVSVVQGTIPEPATFVLIAIGMLAAATARLRKAI